MPYKTLGSRTATGALDTTGQNPGNWTVQFPPNLLSVTVTEFEVYKMIVTGGAPRATFNVFVDVHQWDVAVYAVNNSWDPQQPLLMRFGETLLFFYSDPASDGFQPTITIWLRYEVSIAGGIFGEGR